MRVTCDWLSIVLPYKSVVSTNFDTGKPHIPSHYSNEIPLLYEYLTKYDDWKLGKGNRIFDRSAYSKLGGFTIFWRDTLPFSLIEITGTGCQVLREDKTLLKIAYHYSELLSRIDIACDIHCDITPRDFCTAGHSARFKSYSDIKSETGETYYVGSSNSDRFAYVYRYNAPHPRSHLLRIEFRNKKQNAKIVGSSLRGNTVREIAQSLLNTFQFQHEIIRSEIGKKGIPASPRATSQGSTERWLFQQVLPACKKLIDNGSHDIIDIFGKQLYHYYNEYLMEKENTDGKTTILPDIELFRE